VRNYRAGFRTRAFFKYGTGFDAAYPELDAAARELTDLKRECERLEELASVFEFPQLVEPVTASLKETVEDLVMVKDVWDTAVLCELQFQVRSVLEVRS
jgi:dynein heavy chain